MHARFLAPLAGRQEPNARRDLSFAIFGRFATLVQKSDG